MAMRMDRMVWCAMRVIVHDPICPLFRLRERVDIIVRGENHFVIYNAKLCGVGPIEVQEGIVDCPLQDVVECPAKLEEVDGAVFARVEGEVGDKGGVGLVAAGVG